MHTEAYEKTKNEILHSPMTKTLVPTEIRQPIDNKNKKLRLHKDCGPTWDSQLEK